jgi:hypothetical protein
MVMVSFPKSALPAFVPVTVMIFVPTAKGTDIKNPWLQGIGPTPKGKHSWTVSVAVPLPPAELLQVTALTVSERDPETSTVAWDTGPNVGLAVGISIVTKSVISRGASSSPPPQALSPTSSGASTATSNCFRQLFVLSTLFSLTPSWHQGREACIPHLREARMLSNQRSPSSHLGLKAVGSKEAVGLTSSCGKRSWIKCQGA